jgi:acyl-CoA synthetase (AMP-forming)/AMP-acid ligase II
VAQLSWQTIPEMVLSVGDRFGDSEAVVDGSLRLTFTEFVHRIRCAAGSFAALGIEKGDRVAIWAPNSAEWMIAAFGLMTAGGVLVPVNTRYKSEEAAVIVIRSGAKAVLIQKGFLGMDYDTHQGVPVIYTSGTTCRPKGVMMTHQQSLRLYSEWCDLADLREGDRYLIVNPFFHTCGWKAGSIAAMIRGAPVLPVPVFDIDRVVELIERENVTMLPGPPTLYHSLLEVTDKSKLTSLRTAVTGAADIPVELIRRVHNELPFRSIMTGYGLTEGGTVTASRPGDSFEDIATTVGMACDGMELRVADDGELLVRGYNVMKGYLDDPVATAEAVDADGWLHTGDLATIDDESRVRIVGRKKDMFIVGGINGYPAEIEGFLLEHPAVAQAAVIGVPDDRLGQVGKAFVVPKSTADPAVTAGFKVPRWMVFVDTLPVNATGKVMKDQLQ